MNLCDTCLFGGMCDRAKDGEDKEECEDYRPDGYFVRMTF